MDWLTAVVKIIEAVAWPAVVMAMLAFARPYLKGLLSRIEELTLPGGLGAKFGKELEAVRTAIVAEAMGSAAGTAKVEGPSQPVSKSRIKVRDAEDPFLKLAELFPEAAVLQSYQELEEVFEGSKDIIKDIDPSRGMRNPVNTIMNGLRGAGLLSDNWMDLYGRIRNLRNLAVHGGSGIQISFGEAIEYRALVHLLSEQLAAAIDQYRLQIKAK